MSPHDLLHHLSSGNGLNMYLNPRVRGSIKNSTREGGGEDREVKHRNRHDGARRLLHSSHETMSDSSILWEEVKL
jgi:hypothetical protein